MRVVMFCAGGDMALRPLEVLARSHEIAAVVRPRPSGSLARRVWRRAAVAAGVRRDPVRAVTDARGIRTLEAASGCDEMVLETLRRLRPDVVCIATFPWILCPPMLELAAHGVLNLHASLLPRHRGPNPYFWTYYRDDREVGITVHLATPDVDAGPIVAQDAWALPRGYNVIPLHEQMATRGAAALAEALETVQRGARGVRAQDETRVTPAPRVRPGTPMVDFQAWDVERVWHFLAGMFPLFREPLRCEGRSVQYDGVSGYERSGEADQPGRLEPQQRGWRLHCRGGVVRLAGAGRSGSPWV